MKFTMPDVIPAEKAELDALAAQAAAEIAVFQARHKAGDEFTSEEVERLEYLVEANEKLSEATAELVKAEELASNKMSSLIERTTAKVEPVVDTETVEGEPQPDGETSDEEVAVVAEAEQVIAESVPAPVAATAKQPVSFASGTASTVPNPDEGRSNAPWNLLPSAPNFAQHKRQGATLRDIAASLASVNPGSGQGIQQTGTAEGGMAKQAIASIQRPQVNMAANTEEAVYEFLNNLGKEIPGHGKATAEGLVAAGGWCAPSQQLYNFCDIPPASGLLSLPDFPFDMSRGGVRVPVNPDMSGLLSSMFNYTEAELQAVTSGNPTVTKPIIEIPCPGTFLEWRLEAIGWAAKAGILQAQAWPEAIENALQQLNVAHQQRISQKSIDKMVAGSGTAKVVPVAKGVGATSSILNGLALNAVNLRIDQGLPANAVIEGVAPVWFREVLRADLAMQQSSGTLFYITDEQIDGMLASRNIYLQYVRAYQTGTTGKPGLLATTAFPATADVMLYPAGTWFRSLQNVITLGVQYPLQQLQLNQYTHIFLEDSFQVGKRCNASILVTVPLNANGAIGARVAVTYP